MKRKLSTDISQPRCCKNFSVFACVCAIVSLLVQTYNYLEHSEVDFDLEARKLMKNVLEGRIEEKIDAYLMEISGSTSHRLKREAMLVSTYQNIYGKIYIEYIYTWNQIYL